MFNDTKTQNKQTNKKCDVPLRATLPQAKAKINVRGNKILTNFNRIKKSCQQHLVISVYYEIAEKGLHSDV